MKTIEKCPKCGGEMEEGMIRADPVSGPINIWWVPPNVGFLSNQGERIGFGFTRVEFKGFRCPKCRIVIFSYGKEEEETTEK